ncbi:hypothetical protein B9Z19DRAFT_1069592 [Tuber borchii]|uniref:Uncharacterized protein n=1 Tax=Tuber borchii TaxID=42251 RepID=A0A2T6ZB07_TUBBO|nr:hypothetical protein B9Z19DRAFT_1069592 [Tuber borchii]
MFFRICTQPVYRLLTLVTEIQRERNRLLYPNGHTGFAELKTQIAGVEGRITSQPAKMEGPFAKPEGSATGPVAKIEGSVAGQVAKIGSEVAIFLLQSSIIGVIFLFVFDFLKTSSSQPPTDNGREDKM